MEVEVEVDHYYYLAVARPVFVCSAVVLSLVRRSFTPLTDWASKVSRSVQHSSLLSHGRTA